MYDYTNNHNEDTNWNETYIKWSKLVALYGSNSAEANNPTDPQVNAWLKSQRSKKARGQLDIMKIQMLAREGISWNYGYVPVEKTESTAKPKKAKKPSKALSKKITELLEEFAQRGCWIEIRDSADDWAKLCSQLSTAKNYGKLSNEDVQRLNVTGFIWDWKTFKRHRTWESWFKRLEDYVKENGNPNINRRGSADQTLANWVWTQRQLAKKGEITPEQITKLKNLGVWMDKSEMCFSEVYPVLEAWNALTGDCNLPTTHPDYVKFARIRRQYREGNLSAPMKAKMDKLNFDPYWKANEVKVQKLVDRAIAYYDETGTWDGFNKVDYLQTQIREHFKANTLKPTQISELAIRGFAWRERKSRQTVDDRIELYKQFKAEHGHLYIPYNHPLGDSVNFYRSKYNRGEMSAEDIAKFNAIDFPWNGEGGQKVRTVLEAMERRAA